MTDVTPAIGNENSAGGTPFVSTSTLAPFAATEIVSGPSVAVMTIVVP